MNYYIFYDLDGIHIWSEETILDRFYYWWSSEMHRLDRKHLISKKRCIQDFCAVNWAVPFE